MQKYRNVQFHEFWILLGIVKILNLFIIILCTHFYHFFLVSIHYPQCIHCLLHYMWWNVQCDNEIKQLFFSTLREPSVNRKDLQALNLAGVTRDSLAVPHLDNRLYMSPICPVFPYERRKKHKKCLYPQINLFQTYRTKG